jgi:diaminohydroxyphosphoribosylaminopyrimidine deaminase/5-amino-6-(5-phosphoribosylamino)uracil reductase
VDYLAPALIGDPARGMFERSAPLAALVERVNLAWTSVDRVGDDMRIVARILTCAAPASSSEAG